MSGLIFLGFQGLNHHGNDLKEIPADAVIGSLEDRSGLILVHGDDALGVLHTGQVLDGTGDTQSDIDLGTNGLTGLADLMISREPTSIHSGTAAAYYAAAQGLGQLLGQLDASGNILTDAAADRNDDLGAGQID